MSVRLFSFHGGVKTDGHKHESCGTPIRSAPLPGRLVVPLRQSARAASECLVVAGQKVFKGERIGAPVGVLGTAVHAPTSGTVVAIGDHLMPHPSGLSTLAVEIEPDGEERWIEHAPFDWQQSSRAEALAHLRDCGLVGLGGATFPSHVKLGTGSGIHTLILNGAECEPWITCDDRLMRERAADILAGARILRHLIGAERLLIGIEDNKPEAIAAMRSACAALPGAEVVVIPAVYPAGGEKQLIRTLTGIEIPYGRLGGEFGVQCFNVGTAHAVYRAMEHGEPLISRIVTLTGNVDQPGNFEVLIGTPVEDLLALAGPRRADTDRIIMGGPMMGFALPDLHVPVVKASNCLISASQKLFPSAPPEQACIRCGSCARACPAELQPFEMYWHARAKNFGKAQEYHLFDCIECGCCSYVCPSHIPLVDYFRFAKSEIWARERDKNAADQARERFEFRNWRQEREKEEKAAKLAAKAAETRAKLAEGGEAGDSPAAAAEEDPKKALVAAALARAKAQKAAVAPKNTEGLSSEKQAEIDEIERRRRELGLDAPPSAADDAPQKTEARDA